MNYIKRLHDYIYWPLKKQAYMNCNLDVHLITLELHVAVNEKVIYYRHMSAICMQSGCKSFWARSSREGHSYTDQCQRKFI